MWSPHQTTLSRITQTCIRYVDSLKIFHFRNALRYRIGLWACLKGPDCFWPSRILAWRSLIVRWRITATVIRTGWRLVMKDLNRDTVAKHCLRLSTPTPTSLSSYTPTTVRSAGASVLSTALHTIVCLIYLFNKIVKLNKLVGLVGWLKCYHAGYHWN